MITHHEVSQFFSLKSYHHAKRKEKHLKPNFVGVFIRLYTHYKDSLLKVGWPYDHSPQYRGSWDSTLAHIIDPFSAASGSLLRIFGWIPGSQMIHWTLEFLLGKNGWQNTELKDDEVTPGNLNLVGGWTNPSEKYARQIGSFPQVGGKIKNIWNHQPAYKKMGVKTGLPGLKPSNKKTGETSKKTDPRLHVFNHHLWTQRTLGESSTVVKPLKSMISTL